MLEELTKAEVRTIENGIDTDFESTPLPSEDLNTARWIICAQSEDVTRFLLMRAAKTWHQESGRSDRAEFTHGLDRNKYALRHALDLCAKLLPTTIACGPIRTTPESYRRAGWLMLKADEFADATRVLSSFYANSTKLLIDRTTGTLETSASLTSRQYGSLEALINADKGDFSPISLLVGLFCGPAFEMQAIDSMGYWGKPIHHIVNKAKLKNGRIHYNLITEYARSLFDDLNERPFSAPPEGWVFPWSSVKEAQSYFAALQTICIYNLLSVHFGARRHGLKGGGLDQICYSSDAAKLNDDLARISRLPLDVVGKITTALILGEGTTTPDPALQPLIPIGCNHVAVPGFQILSSNWPRNMLSLHARVSENSFNANSAAFERAMISALVQELPPRFQWETSYYVPTPDGQEEVDLVLIDNSSRTILLGELRWMIQPGDVREVLNRKKVIGEKVDQAWRKVAGARDGKVQFLQKLKLSGDWSIYGAVVIDGFGGAPSHKPKEVPVIPRDIFVEMLRKAPNLEHAHTVMCTPLWLPRNGSDFALRKTPTKICGTPFNRAGIEVGQRSYMNESLGMYLDAAYQKTPDDLRSVGWPDDI